MIKNFNVWPSELFPGVKEFLCDAIQNDTIIMPHRSQEFSNLYSEIEKHFSDFFEIPEDYRLFFTYSATDGMDIIINALESEDITHVTNWFFWDLFINGSKAWKKNIKIKSWENQKRYDLNNIQWSEDVLIITANDTSTGFEYNNEELKKVRKNNTSSKVIIDATSSFWALKYDISLANAWILSVQKNIWLPSGLGILIVHNSLIDESHKKAKKWKYIWWHNSLVKLESFYQKYHTPATPNTLLISWVWFISQQYKTIFWSIEALDIFTKQKAEYFYKEIQKIDWLDVYNKGAGKSQTTFVLSITEEKLNKVNKVFEEHCYTASPGLFELTGKVIRIANFPVHSMNDIQELIKLLK
jgi:phosphoserine aminotransferase